jgi:hypothetical protein
MTLDELFDVADCYVEEFNIYSQSPYISQSPYVKDTFTKDWTVTCTYPYPKDSAANQILKLKGGITYDNNSTCASGTSDRWIEGEH